MSIRQPDEHVHEHGRRYHGFREGAYIYPNDDSEQDRLDIFHKIFLVARNGELHRAPISTHTPGFGPLRILDLGTGTGIWAIEMADKYPTAEIIGTDLSPIQPKWIPPNIRFQVSDFESEWTFGRATFDLIHLRMGIGSISSYRALYRKVFEHLKPHYGWFEYVDFDITPYSDDGSLTTSHALYRWTQNIFDATAAAGKPLRYEHRTRELLREAGFVDIQEVVVKVPINPTNLQDPHHKELARWYNLGVAEGLEAMSLGPLCRVSKWPHSTVMSYLNEVRADINSRHIHAYNNMHVWIARRPA